MKKIPYLPLLLLCTLFFVNFSCNSVGRQGELAKIDTLQIWIQEAKETLVIDQSIFAERRDTIDQRMKFILRHYTTDTVGWDLQMIMTDYRGLHRAYRGFMKNYPELKKENEEHAQRIENLKKDVLEDNMSKEEFNQHYIKERKIIKDHLKNVKETVGKIISLEPEYKRLNPKVEEIYKKARKQQQRQSSPAG